MALSATVIGAGLAGSEAAWQLACANINVTLIEMKPVQRTPAQVSDHFAELVCSNSLRSKNVQNAVGCLKDEMYRLDSLIVHTALAHQVPAGDALAVDRHTFGQAIDRILHTHPRIHVQHQQIDKLPTPDQGPCIVATGPLTSDGLAQAITDATGQDRLYFYDALAPIIAADSIDQDTVFAASRWDKGCGDDYLNCPMDKEAYEKFYTFLLQAESMPAHSFESPKYFQGCLPVEVIAATGIDALRFGPMKPAGLTHPKTGRWPYAVVQLRCEDVDKQAYNLVGFQTKLKYPEQKRLLALIPGLERAEILRYGAMHRNTYLDSPHLLDAQLRLKTQPHLRFAGQITGVEGYVESAASGLMAGRFLAAQLHQQTLSTPPLTTAIGALLGHVRGEQRLENRPHEPQNVNWSMVPPLTERSPKSERKRLRRERAVTALAAWANAENIALRAPNDHIEDAPHHNPAKKMVDGATA